MEFEYFTCGNWDWEFTGGVSEKLASFGIMGVPFEPLNAVMVQEVSGGVHHRASTLLPINGIVSRTAVRLIGVVSPV